MQVLLPLSLMLSSLLPAADLKKAEELYEHRQYREALGSIDSQRDDPQVRFLLARIYFAQGDLKRATEVLMRLTEQYQNNSDYFDWLGKVYGRRAEEANPFSAAGLAIKARDAFEKAVQLNGNNKDALSDLFDYYISAPGFMGGGIDKAAAIAEKNMGINPQEGLLEKSKLAEKRKELPAAESYLRQAIKTAPKAPDYYAELARFLSRQERFADADAVYVEAFKQMPETPRLLFERAQLLVKTKRNLTEAKDLLDRYLKAPLTSDDPSPERARALLKQLG